MYIRPVALRPNLSKSLPVYLIILNPLHSVFILVGLLYYGKTQKAMDLVVKNIKTWIYMVNYH